MTEMLQPLLIDVNTLAEQSELVKYLWASYLENFWEVFQNHKVMFRASPQGSLLEEIFNSIGWVLNYDTTMQNEVTDIQWELRDRHEQLVRIIDQRIQVRHLWGLDTTLPPRAAFRGVNFPDGNLGQTGILSYIKPFPRFGG